MVGDTINMGKISFHQTSDCIHWYLHNPFRRREANTIHPLSNSSYRFVHGLRRVSKSYIPYQDAMITSKTTIATDCNMSDISVPGQRGIDLDWEG